MKKITFLPRRIIKYSCISLFGLLLFLFSVSCYQSPPQQSSEVIDQALENITQLRLTHPDSALSLLHTLASEHEKQFTDRNRFTYCNLHGNIAFVKREVDEAQKWYQSTLEMAERFNDTILIAQTHINIANVLQMNRETQKAIEHFRQAQTLLSTQTDARFLRRAAKNSLAMSLTMMGQMDSALYHVQTAFDMARAENDTIGQANSLMGMSRIYSFFREYSNAEKSIRAAILLMEAKNADISLRTAYANLASTLLSQNEWDEALLSARKSDEIAQLIGAPATAQHRVYIHRARWYRDRGDYQNSLLMAQNALVHAINGDIEQFQTALETEATLRDSLFMQQHLEAIQELQIKYEAEQRALQIALQEKGRRSQRIVIMFVSLIALIVIGISVLIAFYHRTKMQCEARIVKQYEANLQLKKETPKQIDSIEVTEKAVKRKEMLEKLLPGLERLFKEDKIYKQPRLSVDEVAKMLNTNRTYLSSIFNDCYQTKFSDYVNTYRIDDAIEMFKEMRQGGKYANFTIQTIAEEAGFNTRASFYTAFKQIIGVTPTEYLKINTPNPEK